MNKLQELIDGLDIESRRRLYECARAENMTEIAFVRRMIQREYARVVAMTLEEAEIYRARAKADLAAMDLEDMVHAQEGRALAASVMTSDDDPKGKKLRREPVD